jgi:O-antigen ligase
MVERDQTDNSLVKEQVSLIRMIWSINLTLLWQCLRAAIYICFGILSVRMTLIAVEHAPIANPYLIPLLAAALGIVAGIKTSWSLYAFILGAPFLIGFQALGLIPQSNLLSPLFGIIYLAWLFRRIVFERKSLEPRSKISNWIDLLAGLALLSLVVRLWPFGSDVLLYHFWHFQVLSQNYILYRADAAFIFCQGLFFFRMLEMQNDHLLSEKKKILLVICFQAAIIFLFSLIQLVFRTPSRADYAGYGFVIYSPLEDIHSFGSYAVMILALLLGANKALQPGRSRLYGNILLVISAGLLILSYSRAAWIAAFLVLVWFATRKLSLNKKFMIGLVIAIALWGINAFPHYFFSKHNKTYLTRIENVIILEKLPDSLQTLRQRVELWKRAAGIIADYPITGSGIGTFYRLSTFYQDSTETYFKNSTENTHNYLLQLAAELGIPACLIFLVILCLVFKIGFTQNAKQSAVDQHYNRGFLMGISAYLMTCLTGHPLLVSSQQFLFWFMISAVVVADGNEKYAGPGKENAKYAYGAIMLLAGLILAGYLFNHGKADAGFEKYDVGLYPEETSQGKSFRWTSKIGIIKEDHKGRFLEYDVSAMPFNIGSKGLNFKMLLNGDLWEEVNFTQPGTKKIRSYVPYERNRPLEIKTVTSKTFMPVRYGINQDTRDLGVMMSDIKFGDAIPPEGIGFHGWETWQRGRMTNNGNLSKRFRWTGMNASVITKDRAKGGMRLLLMAGHPNIDQERVQVQIWGDREKIRSEIFTDHLWKEISLREEELKDIGVLTFRVSRTWNPKLWGFSQDSRDLGVAVASMPLTFELAPMNH